MWKCLDKQTHIWHRCISIDINDIDINDIDIETDKETDRDKDRCKNFTQNKILACLYPRKSKENIVG